MLSIDKNQMTIEHYQEVLLVSETLIKIRMPQMEISIRGDKFCAYAGIGKGGTAPGRLLPGTDIPI